MSENIAELLAMVTGVKTEGTSRTWTFTVPEPDLPVPTHIRLSIDEMGQILFHPPTAEGLMQQILNRLVLAGFARADEINGRSS